MTYQFYISLNGSSPLVWRRIQVPSTITFYDLHIIIQIVMPWENKHQYEFSIQRDYGKDVVAPMDESDLEDYVHRRKNKLNADTLTLEAYLDKAGTTLEYFYEFDTWCHELVLEKIENTDVFSPRCVEGQEICPFEDFGGLSGFKQLVAILNDPSHPQHSKEMEEIGLEIGDKWEDVFSFDLQKANSILEEVFEE